MIASPGRPGPDTEPLALVTLSDRLRPDIRATLQAFREQLERPLGLLGWPGGG